MRHTLAALYPAPYESPKRPQDIVLDFRRGELGWHMKVWHVQQRFERLALDCPMSGDLRPYLPSGPVSFVEARNA